MEEINKNENLEFNQVYGEIMQVLQDTTRIGASSNSEKEIIEGILKRFTKERNPQKAREEIQAFLNSKEEYR